MTETYLGCRQPGQLLHRQRWMIETYLRHINYYTGIVLWHRHLQCPGNSPDHFCTARCTYRQLLQCPAHYDTEFVAASSWWIVTNAKWQLTSTWQCFVDTCMWCYIFGSCTWFWCGWLLLAQRPGLLICHCQPENCKKEIQKIKLPEFCSVCWPSIWQWR